MTNLRDNVKAFHVAMNMEDLARPAVPSDDVVRLRAQLITEEYFETMRALCCYGGEGQNRLSAAEDLVKLMIADNADGYFVDLAEFADGLADLEYVCEGSFLAFGIDSGPIHAEVQRSNMAKVGGPVREDGKVLKPVGWTPPDIAGEIVKQRG